MLNMTIAEFVEKSHTFRRGEQVGTYNPDPISKDDWIEYAKAHKADILAYLDAKEAEKKRIEDERQAKIDAIPGLLEIRAAISDERRYMRDFNRMMEDESNDGACPPRLPKVSSDDLKKQYPRAAAYLLAEDWALGAHYVKVAAGKAAMEQILNGGDHEEAIAVMRKTFSDYCREHVFD